MWPESDKFPHRSMGLRVKSSQKKYAYMLDKPFSMARQCFQHQKAFISTRRPQWLETFATALRMCLRMWKQCEQICGDIAARCAKPCRNRKDLSILKSCDLWGEAVLTHSRLRHSHSMLPAELPNCVGSGKLWSRPLNLLNELTDLRFHWAVSAKPCRFPQIWRRSPRKEDKKTTVLQALLRAG